MFDKTKIWIFNMIFINNELLIDEADDDEILYFFGSDFINKMKDEAREVYSKEIELSWGKIFMNSYNKSLNVECFFDMKEDYGTVTVDCNIYPHKIEFNKNADFID